MEACDEATNRHGGTIQARVPVRTRNTVSLLHLRWRTPLNGNADGPGFKVELSLEDDDCAVVIEVHLPDRAIGTIHLKETKYEVIVSG
jgi:hypothetical protein